MTYANDWDETLPGADWNDALTPYLTNLQTETTALLRCPSVPEGSGVGYAYNSDLVNLPLSTALGSGDAPVFFDVADLSANRVETFARVVRSGRHRGDCVVFLSGNVTPSVDPDEPVPATLREQCADRLRRIGTAASLYASDYDDRLPVVSWMDSFAPYDAGLNAFRCPAAGAGEYGYAFDPSLLGLDVTTASSPSTLPMAFDSSILTRNALSAYGQNLSGRHEGEIVAYLDGHAAPAP